MDYHKHYDALINRARGRHLGIYTERHHVVPRCMGGGNQKSNLVDLTPEEHFLAHQLLVKMFPGNSGLAFAAHAMTIKTTRLGCKKNKLYGWLKRALSAARTGVPRDAETIQKMKDSLRRSEKAKAARVLMNARRKTPEWKQMQSEALRNSDAVKAAALARRGIPRTEEEKDKTSKSHKSSLAAIAAREALFARKRGVPRSASTRKKLSEVQTGKVLTDEHKENIGLALKGRKLDPAQVEQMRTRMLGTVGTRRGVKLTDETKAKMAAAAYRRYGTTPEQRAAEEARKAAGPYQERAHRAWKTKRANRMAREPEQPDLLAD